MPPQRTVKNKIPRLYFCYSSRVPLAFSFDSIFLTASFLFFDGVFSYYQSYSSFYYYYVYFYSYYLSDLACLWLAFWFFASSSVFFSLFFSYLVFYYYFFVYLSVFYSSYSDYYYYYSLFYSFLSYFLFSVDLVFFSSSMTPLTNPSSAKISKYSANLGQSIKLSSPSLFQSIRSLQLTPDLISLTTWPNIFRLMHFLSSSLRQKLSSVIFFTGSAEQAILLSFILQRSPKNYFLRMFLMTTIMLFVTDIKEWTLLKPTFIFLQESLILFVTLLSLTFLVLKYMSLFPLKDNMPALLRSIAVFSSKSYSNSSFCTIVMIELFIVKQFPYFCWSFSAKLINPTIRSSPTTQQFSVAFSGETKLDQYVFKLFEKLTLTFLALLSKSDENFALPSREQVDSIALDFSDQHFINYSTYEQSSFASQSSCSLLIEVKIQDGSFPYQSLSSPQYMLRLNVFSPIFTGITY